jgi:hypothetical protein
MGERKGQNRVFEPFGGFLWHFGGLSGRFGRDVFKKNKKSLAFRVDLCYIYN